MALAYEALTEYTDQICRIIIPLYVIRSNNDDILVYTDYIKNLYNCEVFIDEHNFLFFIDNVLFTCRGHRRFNVDKVKELTINFRQDNSFVLELPLCTTPPLIEIKIKLNLSTLRNITEICKVNVNGHVQKLQPNFSYGFGNTFSGPPEINEIAIEALPILKNPHLCSPLSKKIKRENMENAKFSKQIYQQTFRNANIQEKRRSIIKRPIDYTNTRLNELEVLILASLTEIYDQFTMPNVKHILCETHNGFLSIMFAICYDVRCNSEPHEIGVNDHERAWNRCVLSTTLCNFETFYSIKDCIVTFMRRCLIYPKMVSYDIGRQCLEDTFVALKYYPSWVMKQLLVTHNAFAMSNLKLSHLNRYFILHYISYAKYCTAAHDNHIFNTLAHNLKNVYLDLQKSDLRLDLYNLDVNFLKELISEVNSLQEADESLNVSNITMTPEPETDPEATLSDEDDEELTEEEDADDEEDDEDVDEEQETDDAELAEVDGINESDSMYNNENYSLSDYDDFNSSCVIDECNLGTSCPEEFSSDDEDLDIF